MLSHIYATQVLKILLMEQDNFTYFDIGEYLNCSKSHAYRLLNGKRTLKLEHFLDLIFLLDITLIDFQSICEMDLVEFNNRKILQKKD